MLAYLVEELIQRDKLMEAKGVYLRNRLQKKVKKEDLEKIKLVGYDKSQDTSLNLYDEFEPLSRPLEEYMELPK